ncbi:MAG: hypothetical protein KIT11_01995 [Fimbriimonadaceae bacterium]|nr:hypothetical protein [Fimbriimonadaceae bacterium]QYK54857.1 MAG: hypothetical protein KF733_07540 [Fimbriimonadaceae bacterium]
MPKILAAADIGSNTVHLLVASVGERGITRLDNLSEWMSLGQVVSREGRLPDPLVEALISTIIDFRRRASASGAQGLYVFATEAMRRAQNHDEAMQRIQERTGVEIQIVPPLREAELGLRGAMTDCEVATPFYLVEAGGGSVQVSLCHRVEEIGCSESLPLGTGVLTQKCEIEHPVDSKTLERARKKIDKELRRLEPKKSERMVACGGVARGFLRALHRDSDRLVHRRELEYLVWATARLPVTLVESRFGVRMKRAVTLLPGALVYLAIMDRLGHEEMLVSEHGVREGAILEMADGRIQPCPL